MTETLLQTIQRMRLVADGPTALERFWCGVEDRQKTALYVYDCVIEAIKEHTERKL